MNPRWVVMRSAGAARVVWAGLLLFRGDRVWRAVAGSGPSSREVWVVRLLGLRHAVQGLAQLVWPSRWIRFWAVVDATHAATMLPLVFGHGPSRRPALVSVAAAAAGTAAAVSRGSST
ncbi:MAG TPA: hypothetical protein VFP34_06100 [Microlunatus sp.]|nr:hypothetical protein [Microlunatus sp.]